MERDFKCAIYTQLYPLGHIYELGSYGFAKHPAGKAFSLIQIYL